MRRIRESVDAPRIYVASQQDYNDGRIEGKWLELLDYDSGEEVGEAIGEFLKELNKSDGGKREEHVFLDFEGFPEDLYGEYMWKSEFNLIIGMAKASRNLGIPVDVIEEYLTQHVKSLSGMDAEDIEALIEEAFLGTESGLAIIQSRDDREMYVFSKE